MNPGDPFPCPGCGATDAWKADYYEAVWQDVELFVGDDGGPEEGDYGGNTDRYDDGSTENEAYVCRECGHTIDLCTFVMVTPASSEQVREYLRGLAGDYDEDKEGSVDDLIAYKNALEDALSTIVGRVGLPIASEATS